ncbi:MAG: peptidase M64 N-terminal domain-containing protein [Pseudoxanthomonas sp.]|nr:peptidase M64 N-terminal domain-containing protein [Pseudoxanthomonas sp.]
MRAAFIASLLLALPAAAAPPATLRVDIQHGGDASTEHFALERLVVEPLPWPGNPARPLDDSNRGMNLVRVLDAETGQPLYSRGYSTIFGEWQSTAEAAGLQRSFQESLRIPMPEKPVTVQVLKRDAGNNFVPA